MVGRSELKGLRCSRSGAGRALLGPRHRNSKTGKLCSGMWLRFKDWYLQKGAEIRFNRREESKVLVSPVPTLPFGTPVVVIALNSGGGLLETDVVEPCKGGAADVFDGVIGDQELLLGAAGQGEGRRLAAQTTRDGEKRCVFGNKWKTNLPPHEDVVAAFQGVVVKVVRVEAFCIFVKRLKLALEGNMQEAGESFIYLRF